jgi:hypothetical protein
MEVVIPDFPELFGGPFVGLPYSRLAAETFNNVVTVLNPFDCPGVTEFRKFYKHDSPNAPWFEQLCFEQWLLIAEWMRRNKKEVIFKADSDTLIFANLQKYWEDNGMPRGSIPAPDSFVTLEYAEFYEHLILNSFQNGTAGYISRKWGEHVADQFLLKDLLVQMRCPCFDSGKQSAVVDTGLYDLGGMPVHEGHKDIWFINGQPIWIRDIGFQKMLTLHCWGPSKKMMKSIWDQSRSSVNSNPVRLTLC